MLCITRTDAVVAPPGPRGAGPFAQIPRAARMARYGVRPSSRAKNGPLILPSSSSSEGRGRRRLSQRPAPGDCSTTHRIPTRAQSTQGGGDGQGVLLPTRTGDPREQARPRRRQRVPLPASQLGARRRTPSALQASWGPQKCAFFSFLGGFSIVFSPHLINRPRSVPQSAHAPAAHPTP